MRVSELLTDEQKKQLDRIVDLSISHNQNHRDSRKDWEHIMGKNRDRYGRGRGGAIRRK